MPLWTLKDVSLAGRGRPRLDGVSVAIPAGRVAVLGASGSGKTSLLNLLVGYEQPDRGRIVRADHQLVGKQPPDDQSRVTLFWSPPDSGLWPHLTVREHLAAVMPEGPPGRGDLLLRQFGLEPVSGAYPASLSQGECSRLTVARAIAAQPRCLVLDEPLEHVDAAHRNDCWRVLREWVAEAAASLVFCTHSAERVLLEAEWCLCLDQGRLVWAGPVEELYSRPSSRAIAAFLGPCNWVDAASDRPFDVREEGTDPLGQRPVRPERLQIVEDDAGPYCVNSERFSGSVAEVEVTRLRTGMTERLYHRPPQPALRAGHRVSLRILAVLFAALVCLWQSGCNRGSAAEMSVNSSTMIRIPVDGKRMPAPRALTIGSGKELYVLDDSGRILVYDSHNTLIRQWRMPESSVGKPEGIRVLQDGRVAIADTHYHRVVFFDQQGTLLSMFGQEGEKPGDFTYPVDLLQDPSGYLYVAEYGGKDRIQKFKPDGTFVLEFGGLGTGIGEFQRPSGMVWIDSKIYVADAINNRVQVFDEQGKSLQVLDWADQGGLYYPYDIALSPHGQLFFVEYGACRVSVADPAGKLVAQFGHEGRGHHELWTPWAVTVSEDHRVFIADTGNRRIVQLTLPGGRL